MRLEQQISYRVLRRAESSRHLAAVLPGRGYTNRMPLLYYATALLLDRGADVVCVDWDIDDGASLEVAQAQAIAAASAAMAEVRAAGDYARVTLVGKSLGTLAAAHLLLQESAVAGAAIVWLTPPLRWGLVREQVAATADRSLLIAGDADPLSDRELVESHVGAKYVVAGGDHSLAIAGDVVASVDALRGVVAAMKTFFDREAQPR